jgi:transposase
VANIDDLIRINKEQADQIAILRQQVEYLKRQLFGRKSEKSLEHLDLFEGEEMQGKPEAETAAEVADKPDKKEKPKGKRPIRVERLPDNLPVVVVELIPEEVKAAPDEWRRMGTEESDQLEKEPGYFYLKRTIRPKFVRRDHPFQPPIMAPAKPKIIDSGFWGDSLLSEILTNKYLYHLPFYRQEQLYHYRFGISLSRKTMGDAAEKVSGMMGVLVNRMKETMILGGHLQIDETPVTYLDPKHPKGSRTGYYWVYRGLNGEVIFDWCTTREHKHLLKWLGKNFSGTLQSDGYGAYEDYATSQALAGKVVIIGKLYGLEETLREHHADAAIRARMRQKHSAPLIKLLKEAIAHLLTNGSHILPKSLLGKALRYALGQWPGMQVYLEHGEVEIDNNLVENAIRPTAVGKKNWLFIGQPEAGERSAVMYTLLISAKAQGIDPQAYLKDLIEKLPEASPSNLDALLPANWAKEFKARQASEKAAQEPVAA